MDAVTPDPATGASPIGALVPLATKVLAKHPSNVHALAIMAEAAAEVLASDDAPPAEKEQAMATATKYYQQLIE
eukprot:3954234-Pyramimonas_sp.AAC.1